MWVLLCQLIELTLPSIGYGPMHTNSLGGFFQHTKSSKHVESRPEDGSFYFSSSMAEVTKRYAVVTSANKGTGVEIIRKQLPSKGNMVFLTARDEKGCGLSDNVVFHQLDVVDPACIASLVEFIYTQFGKLDSL
ncbi:hypothetical protein QQP08_000117, partial [Theobroma cacao]